MKYYYVYEYPTGPVRIAEADGSIVGVTFAGTNPPGGFEERESPLIKRAVKQLDEYFAGKRREFDLPLAFSGTDFQRKVWAALLTIPYGETRTYGEIAAQIGNPQAARAVGMANNRNPISIICPCHRVIGANGALVGYGGGLPAKRLLLDLEK
ncbi:MAG: methylated-DNA--[protein]-cysteine S-methyltransferase [Clostridiales bacterium]|nr:methylated-DNA--[protein]-cysteine S-methyltransferase [Clostridiales bacterium]